MREDVRQDLARRGSDIDISLVWTLKLLTFHSKQFSNMTLLNRLNWKTCHVMGRKNTFVKKE